MQRSFDELGTPLAEVSFCVLDLETTGGSPDDDAITEIGAVRLRGGECLGTFQTLVNPGRTIPPSITVLTGITDALVAPAPAVAAVLPGLVEFIGGAVVVGHNVRFDLGFLARAFGRNGWPALANRSVDTHALARRLVRDEVPNCRLATLASRLRLDHQPSHRALDDALATADLLHALLERAAAWGVLGLDDLLALPRLGGHPQAAKLRLTDALPRRPGVYLLRDRCGEVLYVGKATNLRQRVRSYFSGDDRRKIGGLLRELHGVDHQVCTSPLEATVVERRLIRRLQPRYNRVGRRRDQPAYVRLSVDEAFPRLVLARAARPGVPQLGPLPLPIARLAVDAIHTVVGLRRCSQRVPVGTPRRTSPCAPAQLGVAACPCAGFVDVERYAEAVRQVAAGLSDQPALLLDPLALRMRQLAAAQRYEEAADVRDRASALAEALRRRARIDQLQRAGRLRLRFADGAGAELDGGVLVAVWGVGVGEGPRLFGELGAHGPPDDPHDEALCVAAWLDGAADTVLVERCDGELTSPVRRLPSFLVAARGGRAA